MANNRADDHRHESNQREEPQRRRQGESDVSFMIGFFEGKKFIPFQRCL